MVRPFLMLEQVNAMTAETLVPLTMAMGTSAASTIDIWIRRVPNTLTLPFAAFGVMLGASGFGLVSFRAALFGGVIGLLLMLPSFLIGATGGGDVKLFAAVSTLLGPWGSITAFVYTLIAGFVLAIIVAVSRGRLRTTIDSTSLLIATGGATAVALESAGPENRFAYAPAIAIGGLLVALGF
jgi:prepilin peptidase CpaA